MSMKIPVYLSGLMFYYESFGGVEWGCRINMNCKKKQTRMSENIAIVIKKELPLKDNSLYKYYEKLKSPLNKYETQDTSIKYKD